MSETTYEVEYLKTRCKPNESRNAYIERISQNKIINFICWDKIEKVEYLRTGGSAIINKAEWIEKRMTVVLKTVTENINSVNDEFIQEIKVFHNIELVLSNAENKEKAPIVGYENVIKFFGVSSDKSELYLVFEYAELGDLRDYLSHNTLNWELKVNIARQTTCGLYFLHKNGILHCDLHTKNVVIQKNGDGIRAIITDFGLSNVLPRNSKSNQQIAGCVPFVDPKLANTNGTPDYKSDIYSLGVVLWEITSNGRPPFIELIFKAGDVRVLLQIIKGMREEPIKGSTSSYVKLYTNCWSGNPTSRPEIDQVYKSIHQEDIITGEKWKQTSQRSSKKKHAFNDILEQLSTKDLEMIRHDPDLVQAAVQQTKREKVLPV